MGSESKPTNKGIGRYIRMRELVDLIKISKSTIYRKIKAGIFPQGIKLSDRIIVWNTNEIDQWIYRNTND